MKLDRKTTALKALQGFMWKTGYQNGELKALVFDDILPAFKYWKDNSIIINIYSSGSIGINFFSCYFSKKKKKKKKKNV